MRYFHMTPPIYAPSSRGMKINRSSKPAHPRRLYRAGPWARLRARHVVGPVAASSSRLPAGRTCQRHRTCATPVSSCPSLRASLPMSPARARLVWRAAYHGNRRYVGEHVIGARPNIFSFSSNDIIERHFARHVRCIYSSRRRDMWLKCCHCARH